MQFDLFLFFFSSGLFTKLEQSFSCDFSSPDKSISALFHKPAPGPNCPDNNSESSSVPIHTSLKHKRWPWRAPHRGFGGH